MKFYVTLLLFTTFSICISQSFDNLISKDKIIDCNDVTNNAASIIENFYDNYELTKIYDFLDYWEKKCGPIEAINRLKTLIDIKLNRFSNNELTSYTIDELMFYKSSIVKMSDSLTFEDDYYQKIESIDKLTQKIAKSTNSVSSDYRLLLDFYSKNKPTFKNIREAPENSSLKQLYDSIYQKTSDMFRYHYALMIGTVNYQGNTSLFGNRPHIGMLVGVNKKRHNLDLSIDIRIGPSKEAYTFSYLGNLITHDEWTGFYIGAEYTYDFYTSDKFSIGISPGIGYDQINALTVEEDSDEDGKLLGSLNLNIGVSMKYKIGHKGWYVGLQSRFNTVDYNNPFGTRLDGQYLNFRLTIGRLFNPDRNFRLKSLQ